MSGVGYHACLVPLALSQDKCPLSSLMRMRAKKTLSPSYSSPSFCQRLPKAKWEINQAKHTSLAGCVLLAVASDLFGTHFYPSAERGCFSETLCSLPGSLPTSVGGAQVPQVRSSPVQNGNSGEVAPTVAGFLGPSPFPMSPLPNNAARGLGPEGGLW